MLSLAENQATSKADRVNQALVKQYGQELLWQVERMSENFFRAWLNNGNVVMAAVQEDGTITMKDKIGRAHV